MEIKTVILRAPVMITSKENGVETDQTISTLEMREPTLKDFSKMKLSDLECGQIMDVAARCCLTIPHNKFMNMSARNMTVVMEWAKDFLDDSQPTGTTSPEN